MRKRNTMVVECGVLRCIFRALQRTIMVVATMTHPVQQGRQHPFTFLSCVVVLLYTGIAATLCTPLIERHAQTHLWLPSQADALVQLSEWSFCVGLFIVAVASKYATYIRIASLVAWFAAGCMLLLSSAPMLWHMGIGIGATSLGMWSMLALAHVFAVKKSNTFKRIALVCCGFFFGLWLSAFTLSTVEEVFYLQPLWMLLVLGLLGFGTGSYFIFFPPNISETRTVPTEGVQHRAKGRWIYFMLLFMALLTTSWFVAASLRMPLILKAGGVPEHLIPYWISMFSSIALVVVALRFHADDARSTSRYVGMTALLGVLALIGLSFSQTWPHTVVSSAFLAACLALLFPLLLELLRSSLSPAHTLHVGLVAAISLAVALGIARPWMNYGAELHTHVRLPEGRTIAVLDMASAVLPEYLMDTPLREGVEVNEASIALALDEILAVQNSVRQQLTLPLLNTTPALRALMHTNVPIGLVEEAATVLGPAEAGGGRVALRYLAPLGIILSMLGFGFAAYLRRNQYDV